MCTYRFVAETPRKVATPFHYRTTAGNRAEASAIAYRCYVSSFKEVLVKESTNCLSMKS